MHLSAVLKEARRVCQIPPEPELQMGVSCGFQESNLGPLQEQCTHIADFWATQPSFVYFEITFLHYAVLITFPILPANEHLLPFQASDGWYGRGVKEAAPGSLVPRLSQVSERRVK